MIVARVLLGPLLRPHLDSVDIMQSVHRSLLVGLRDQKFDISSPERLVGLACTMVRRKVARNWRRHRRQIRWESPAVEQDSLIQTLHSLVQTEPGPASQAEYNDQVADLYKSLSNVERAMLEKRLEGYTTGEVAEQLNMNPIAIRVRWSRLRQRLETAGIVADWL